MKRISLLLFLISSAILSFAQNTVKDVFSTNDIVWFGLDFSKARFIGEEGFKDPVAIKNFYFNEWNQLILRESEKYDIKKAFYKSDVTYDLSAVKASNEQPNPIDMVINSSYSIDKSDVESVVKSFKPEINKGIGVVFVVESFNKFEEKGRMWVTFFDIATKKVLLTENIEGKAGGFGFRNYWARAIYNVLNSCPKLYKKWRKEYGD